MKKILVSLLAAAIATPAAAAPSTTGGQGALALAALVGGLSPTLSASRRHALARYLGGHRTPVLAPFHVKADSVACRASNIDPTHHDCTLKFGAATRTLNGRRAHELFATLQENGVPGDAGAGSSFETLSALDCTITPADFGTGAGAACTYTPGP